MKRGNPPHLYFLVRLLAHHDGVLQTEVQHDLRVVGAVARLVEGVLDVHVQYVQSLRHWTRKVTNKKRVRGARRYWRSRGETHIKQAIKIVSASSLFL